MATGIGPIRGDLVRVQIELITRKVKAAEGATATTSPIIVKMKRGVAEFFGLTPMLVTDPAFNGVFPNVNGNLNALAKYRKHVGGRGDASYTFVSAGSLDIKEYFYNAENVQDTEVRTVKSFSQGFPRGHSMNEIIAWLATLEPATRDKLRSIISPAGTKTDLQFAEAEAAPAP